MHHYIQHVIQTYGYPGLFVALALEYFFIPVPGETTLTMAGIFGRLPQYHLNLMWLITATALGTFTGAMAGYVIGRTVGRPFLERFGKYVGLTPKRIDKAHHLFSKYTLPTLIFSRYIAGVRIIVPYIAGINETPLTTFIPVILLSSFAWTASFIMAGSVIERAGRSVIAHWRQDLVPAIIILVIIGVGYYFLHRWLKQKMDGHDDPAQDAGDHTPSHKKNETLSQTPEVPDDDAE